MYHYRVVIESRVNIISPGRVPFESSEIASTDLHLTAPRPLAFAAKTARGTDSPPPIHARMKSYFSRQSQTRQNDDRFSRKNVPSVLVETAEKRKNHWIRRSPLIYPHGTTPRALAFGKKSTYSLLGGQSLPREVLHAVAAGT